MFDCQWSQFEGCVYILTAVAPRMNCGKDEVIPTVLDLVPRIK